MSQRWHPDKIANGRADPARAEEAKARFQQIHEAYKGTSHWPPNSLFYICFVGEQSTECLLLTFDLFASCSVVGREEEGALRRRHV
jgi:hypothetical protein